VDDYTGEDCSFKTCSSCQHTECYYHGDKVDALPRYIGRQAATESRGKSKIDHRSPHQHFKLSGMSRTRCEPSPYLSTNLRHTRAPAFPYSRVVLERKTLLSISSLISAANDPPEASMLGTTISSIRREPTAISRTGRDRCLHKLHLKYPKATEEHLALKVQTRGTQAGEANEATIHAHWQAEIS
jgi:hypothetical protein